MTQVGLLLACGVAAGFVNVVAGGGSLLMMPLMIFLGMPEGVANGTARIAIGVQNLTAVARYHRAGRLPWVHLRRLALPAVLGGLLGAWLSVQLGDLGFRRLLGWVMLGCALLVLRPLKPASSSTSAGAASDATPQLPGAHTLGFARVWLVGLLIGFYGGVVQAGVGYLILFLLTTVLRLPLLEANILKVAIVLCYTPVVLLVFGFQGMLWLAPAVSLSIGGAIGGWLGASAALERGAGLIRALLVVVVVASAARLLGLF